MIAFKCKMCGGDMELQEGATVAECPYCMTKQTLPKLDNDKRVNMYDRANHFRRLNEYDKAMGIFENILQEDRTDAEVYWSLVLCRYGIEYVEDPTTHKRIPTVNRVQYTSILADEDYKSALEYADSAQRSVYESEAKAIDEIQKGILAISKQEKPFDVFICYKETDANGRRTPDSVLANDLYHQLTKEGFKVFFSRITLEDKIGAAYEPYIFAALNSAKVMVVLGTKPEYFNAVWVKNEWSRYLALIRASADKTLIPAYKDMDPYDLPDDFSHLQAQDMGKLGFMQDLIRGIKKIVSKGETAEEKTTTQASNSGVTIESLMKRAKLFLEDGDYESADEYLDKVLDIDPEYAPAYVGKTQVDVEVPHEADLTECLIEYENSNDWKKVIRFANSDQKALYEGYVEKARAFREEKRKEDIYQEAVNLEKGAITEADFLSVANIFDSIGEFRDAIQCAVDCRDKADKAREKLRQHEEANRIEEEKNRQREEARKIEYKKKKKKIIMLASSVIALVTIIVCAAVFFFVPNGKYKHAEELLRAGDSDEAYSTFMEIKDFRDASDRAGDIIYKRAEASLSQGEYFQAVKLFNMIYDYRDSLKRAWSIRYKYLKEYQVYHMGWTTAGYATDFILQDQTVKHINFEEETVSSKGPAIALSYGSVLRADGTAYFPSEKVTDYQRRQFTNLVQIDCFYKGYYGLKADGTVVTFIPESIYSNKKYGKDLSEPLSTWTGIVKIQAAENESGWPLAYGLRYDGTVLCAESGETTTICSKVVDIAFCHAGGGGGILFCLVENGEIRCFDENRFRKGREWVADWKDTVYIHAGDEECLVGMNKSGEWRISGEYYSDRATLNSETINIAGDDSNKIIIRRDGTAYILYQYTKDEQYQERVASLTMIGMGSELE